MQYRSIVALAAALSLLPLSAQAAPRPGLAAAVHRMVADGFTATVVRVRDGERVMSLADGVADVRTGEPARTGDRFRIASNTKSFVAVVVLQLEAAGLLSVEDSAARWVPGLDPRITVRQLLDHTSGLYDPTTQRSFWQPYLDDDRRGYVYTPERVIRMALAHGPTGAPGAGYAYSNTGYLVLGEVIERVTGHSPGTEIQRRLLDPLGLHDTYFPVLDPVLHGPHLHGYDMSTPMRDMTTFSPSYDWTAGAMVSTVEDLARFHEALFAGRLLPAAQQQELLTGNLGIERVPSPCGGMLVGQTGAGPGYTSMSLSTEDGRRQLVLVGTRFDVAKEIAGEPPVPTGAGSGQVLSAAFCD